MGRVTEPTPRVTHVIELHLDSRTFALRRQWREPATGLWNRLRRRRWVLRDELVGLYACSGPLEFEAGWYMNRPGRCSVRLEGVDPLSRLRATLR